MDAGGRKEIYKLMNMTKPSMPERLKPKKGKLYCVSATYFQCALIWISDLSLQFHRMSDEPLKP